MCVQVSFATSNRVPFAFGIVSHPMLAESRLRKGRGGLMDTKKHAGRTTSVSTDTRRRCISSVFVCSVCVRYRCWVFVCSRMPVCALAASISVLAGTRRRWGDQMERIGGETREEDE